MTPPTRRSTYFATCAPGIEPLLHREVRELRFARVERQVGGVRFDGSTVDEWRANLELRTAIRVLRRVDVFEARTEAQLYEGVSATDWSEYLKPDGTLVVSAQTKESTLDHSLFVAQMTKDAVCDQFLDRDGVRPSVDKDDPDLSLHLHLFRDRATLSIDTSGASLHKRGWRREPGEAHLAETLAAAIVLLGGWDRRSPLVDPFCGSGTILVEAALIANGIAPGLFRDGFGFERLPGHDAARYAALKERVRQSASPRKIILRGLDLDPKAARAARANAASAGIESGVEITVGDAREFDFRRGWNAWIVTNPPYGERVGNAPELEALYREFGARVRSRCGGYHLALLSGNPRLTRALGIDIDRRTQLANGGIPCELLHAEIPR